jgi:uncharacterized protein YkwD
MGSATDSYPVFNSRNHRNGRIAALAAAAIAVAGVAAPAASAHTVPDPVAHIAVGFERPDPVAHVAAAHAKGCANANVPAARASKSEMRKAVVCLINKERTSRGLPALHVSAKLDSSAQGWTNTMVDDDSFTHGEDFAARISATGFQWSEAGENIASGYRTPAQVVSAWMASPGHCRNILDPQYAEVGTGVVARAVRSAASQPSTWTQDFALGLYQQAPSANWGPADGCGAE